MNDLLARASLEAFAASISSQPLGLVRHRPRPDADHANCLANASAAVKEAGGDVRYGWHFQIRTSLEFGDYIVATYHAVWHEPTDHGLVDVTPFHPDEHFQPITQNGDLLFLVDDAAEPFETNGTVIALPHRFHAITDAPEIQEYVARLQQVEYRDYNGLHGSAFPYE
jgi:hypothetical protein